MPIDSHNINKHIHSYLEDYLGYEAPGYAVLINAKWGGGKTHFVKNFIKNDSAVSGRKYIYISLNGLATIQEVYDLLLVEMLPAVNAKGFKITGRIFKTALSCLANDSQLKLSDFVNPYQKNNIYVFDDIERFRGPVEETFGFLNMLVEHEGMKVFLLSNEEEVARNNENYKRVKEKTIGKTLRLYSDFDSAYDCFADMLSDSIFQDLLKKNSELVKTVYLNSELNNLRLLRQAILGFSSFFSAIDEKYLKDDEAVSVLLGMYFSFFLEYHSGRILEVDLEERKSFSEQAFFKYSDNYKKDRIDFMEERYPWIPIRDDILSNDALVSIFVDGFMDGKKINGCIKSSSYYVDVDQEPEWKTLWRWEERTKGQFQEALNLFEKKFDSVSYMDEGVILHVVGIRIALAKTDFVNYEVDEAVVQLKKYIKDFFAKVDEKSYFTDSFLVHYNDSSYSSGFHGSYDGLGFKESSTEEFKELIKFFDDSFNRKLQEALPAKSRDLLDLMESNISDFYMKVCVTNSAPTPYFKIPILSYIEPDHFVDKLLSLEPAVVMRSVQVFRSRFQSIPDSVKETEKVWLAKVMNVLSERANDMDDFDKARVAYIIKYYIEPYAQ